MAREVRTFAEGALRWAQASGTGGWATASGALTALIGFVQAGMTYNSARGVPPFMKRGTPNHHKSTTVNAQKLQFTYLQAVTGNKAAPATASGASTPQVHLELKITDTELPSVTAQYFQFLNCVKATEGWAEGENGNQWQETWRGVSVVGPSGRGYTR